MFQSERRKSLKRQIVQATWPLCFGMRLEVTSDLTYRSVPFRPDLRAVPVGPAAFYSMSEIATLSGLGRTTLYRLTRAGRGPKLTKLAGRTMVKGADYILWAGAQ